VKKTAEHFLKENTGFIVLMIILGLVLNFRGMHRLHQDNIYPLYLFPTIKYGDAFICLFF
jgi:hypothetical protein